jgi:hypothetical protein
MKTFQHISKDTQDTMVANFLETIGNLEAIVCPDLDETMDAIEVIGMRLRAESPGRGLTTFARLILDRACTANF